MLISRLISQGDPPNQLAIRTAYEELKGNGVTFLQEPAKRPGIKAMFRDDSGNWFSLNQHKRYGS
jgi:hypothetical protein